MIFSEERMAQAAAELSGAMLSGLPEPEECRVEFSAWFEKKMKRVLSRGNHPVAYRVLRRAASIVLVLFLGFAALMVVSPTVRASVYGWIREQCESLMHYYFEDGAAPVEDPTTYCITNLPAQYSEVTSSYNEENGNYLGVYADDEGNMMYFMYSLIPDNSNYFITEDGYAIEHVYVSNNTADFYLANDPSDSNAIIWCDSETNAVFCITAKLAKEELIALAESVQPHAKGPTLYCISNLPQQYTELTSNFNEDLGEYIGVYSDDEGNILYFMYSLIPEISNYYLGSVEDYIVEQVYIAGNAADYYQSKDRSQSNGIIWYDAERNAVFCIIAKHEKEEIIAMAGNVEPVE